MTFSSTDKYKTVLRELSYRRFVYPKLVASRKITQEKADRDIAIMEEIAADYAKLQERDRPTLFSGS